MQHVRFQAPDYAQDTSFHTADYSFSKAGDGWRIERGGETYLELGPGYRLLATEECGVCSTDLARHFLPFPLPQVTGHELVARDESGQRYVVEINASHEARGVTSDCVFCNNGLERHCPERLVLGIHDLPGGFGPWILAPERAAIPVPDSVPSEAAVLVEPFAAALNAATTCAPRTGETVAVLGPRRLGMLVVAALAAHRTHTGHDFEILALSRHEKLNELARDFGATSGRLVEGDGTDLPDGLADIVVDTTGNPEALALALRLAKREVHIKSTHGQTSCGLSHLTELVVDELWIGRLPHQAPSDESSWLGSDAPRVAWLNELPVPAWVSEDSVARFADAATALAAFERDKTSGVLPRADAAVVGDLGDIDRAIRPRDDEISLVKPRGGILVHPDATLGATPLAAALARGVRLSSSRCGDFRHALSLMESQPELHELGRKLVTHSFDIDDIEHAFSVARSKECIKAVIHHGESR